MTHFVQFAGSLVKELRLSDMLSWLAKRARRKRNAHDLYGSIVALSRSPDLYAELEVPDTLEARFEILVLHMFIFIERLQRSGGEGQELAQDLVDLFFADMDTTSREAGVGDLAVPKKMRKLAAVFRERMTQYGEAINAPGRSAITKAFKQNIYHGNKSAGRQATKLSAYARDLRSELARRPTDELQFAHERSMSSRG